MGLKELTRAFSDSVAGALASAQLNPLITMIESQIRFPIQYPDTLLYLFKDEVLRNTFDTDMTLTLRTQNMGFFPHLQEVTHGQIEVLSPIEKIIESKP